MFLSCRLEVMHHHLKVYAVHSKWNLGCGTMRLP